MDFLKEFFENEETFNTFSEAVKSKGLKLADLSKGEYVSAKKASDNVEKVKKELQARYDAELAKVKATSVETPPDLKAAKDGDKLKDESIAEIEKRYEEMTKVVEELRRKNELAEQKAAFTEARGTFLAAGGDEELADDWVKIMLGKTSENAPFDEVLKEYKGKYPKLFSPKGGASLPPLAGGEPDKAESEKMKAKLRETMGLKNKTKA
jgi:hypothetical protein